MAPSFLPRETTDEPTNKTATMIRVYGAMLALTSVGFAARIASQRMKRSQIYIEDFLLLWAYVSQ